MRFRGSDVRSTPLIERLRTEGVRVTIGHDAANVDGAATVVVSSAIDRRNPEYVAAQRLGVPMLHRGEMLAKLVRERRGIAICGTHGKTTTTAMVHSVLRAGKVDASLVLGGIDGALGTNAHDGKSPWFVTEADESDGSFALLDPVIAIVTNIENDHLQSDDELPQLVNAFEEFLAKLPEDGAAIVGVDDALAASLIERERRAPTVTFGFGPRADVRAANVHFEGLGMRVRRDRRRRVSGNHRTRRSRGDQRAKRACSNCSRARARSAVRANRGRLASVSRRAPPVRHPHAQRPA